VSTLAAARCRRQFFARYRPAVGGVFVFPRAGRDRLEAACAERGRNQAGSPVFESEPMAVSSRRAGGGTAQNGRGTLADDGEKEP